MSLTSRFVEERLKKNRHAEAKNSDLRKMLVTHNILAGHGRSEAHVEELRRKRTEAAERRDLFMDYTYVKGAQEQDRKALVAEAEERVVDELARQKAENERLEQNRRRVCAGSEELRVLKERLHAAKVNKERAQQLMEIEFRKEKHRLIEHQIAEHLENERLKSVELDHKSEIEKLKQRERVKYINQEQIAANEAKREEAMTEYKKERAQVQELVDRLQQQDDDESAAKERKRKESREMLMKFKIEQAERQEQQEQDEIDENNRIAKFAADKADREEQLAREKEEQEKEKERVLLGIIEAANYKNKQAEELEFLRNELRFEEHEHKAREKEAAKRRKIDQDREDMKAAYTAQMEQRRRKEAEMKQEEDSLRDILLSKFAEDERIQQMNEQKRRMRVQEHKREAERLVNLRREAYQKTRNNERAELQRLEDEKAADQIIIEEERQKLIQDFAIPLRDFLPKGTMQNRGDFDAIFSDMRSTQYCSKRPGSLTAR
jgi:hypothetical protein